MSILGTTGGPKFIESCAWTLGTHLGWLIVSPETSSHTFLNIQINYDRNYVAVWPPKSTQFGGRIFIWSTVFLRNKTSFKWTFFQKKMVSYGMRIIKFIFFECGPPKKAKYSPNESIGKSCITVLTTLSVRFARKNTSVLLKLRIRYRFQVKSWNCGKFLQKCWRQNFSMKIKKPTKTLCNMQL